MQQEAELVAQKGRQVACQAAWGGPELAIVGSWQCGGEAPLAAQLLNDRQIACEHLPLRPERGDGLLSGTAQAFAFGLILGQVA